MEAEPLLEIAALGPTVVSRGGIPLQGGWLRRRPGGLLKFLIARRGRVTPVDEIAEGLWPGSGYSAAGNVRYYVHVLRRTLEPHGADRARGSLVRCAGGAYALDMGRIALDVNQFERALAAGETERAVGLYRGELLADEPYAVWAHSERQRLHELACDALRSLAAERLALGSLCSAHESLVRLAAMQPYDEDVHRDLIGLDLARGRRSDALRRYESLCLRLSEAFGERPGFSLSELGAGASPGTPGTLAAPLRFHRVEA